MFEYLLSDISRLRLSILFFYYISLLLSENTTVISDNIKDIFGGRPLRALSILSIFYFLFFNINFFKILTGCSRRLRRIRQIYI